MYVVGKVISNVVDIIKAVLKLHNISYFYYVHGRVNYVHCRA